MTTFDAERNEGSEAPWGVWATLGFSVIVVMVSMMVGIAVAIGFLILPLVSPVVEPRASSIRGTATLPRELVCEAFREVR